MKRLKTENFSLLTRIFPAKKAYIMTVTVLGGFTLAPSARLIDEGTLWDAAAAAMDKSQALDLGLPKPRGELLAAGKFCAPGGKPVQAGQAVVSLGPITKKVMVFGPRYWKKPLPGLTVISDPEPITVMDISWSRAFGGPEYPTNPLGQGLRPLAVPSGQMLVPLPNVENPAALIASLSDRPTPAGFAPRGLDWPSPLKKTGTFDSKWFYGDWPGYPEDFSWQYYNLAPADQLLKGYFKGDENISIENMHPEKPLLKAKLPGLRSRVFVNRQTPEGETFEEAKTSLDTVWLWPNLALGAVIWRASLRIRDEDAGDITHLLAFSEPLVEEPLPVGHYQQMLTPPPISLAVEEPAPATTPRPESAPAPEPEPVPEPPDKKNEALEALKAELNARVKVSQDKLVQHLRSIGLDPSLILMPAAPSLPKPPAGLGPDQMMAAAAGKALDSQKMVMDLLKKFGLSLDRPLPVSDAPPPVSAQQLIGLLKRLPGDHRQTIASIKTMEAERQKLKSRLAALSAQAKPPGDQIPELKVDLAPLEKPEARTGPLTREAVLLLQAQGQSLAGKDLTGLDLSGCDLSEADLSGAILEQTDLTQAILEKARLNRAVLTGANLSGARLGQAVLTAVVGVEACFAKADLNSADLSMANLSRANLEEANLTGARMTGVDLTKANLKKALASKIQAPRAGFAGADLSEAVFAEANLPFSDFTGALLSKTDFSQARARESSWAEAKGQETNFQGADLTASKADGKTVLTAARFKEADLTKAYWENTDFSRADFSRAILRKATLTGCILQGAGFLSAEAQEAEFSKSDLTGADMRGLNLFQGSLRQAALIKTDLRSANLFAVDFHQSVHGETRLEGANLNKTILTVKWPK